MLLCQAFARRCVTEMSRDIICFELAQSEVCRLLLTFGSHQAEPEAPSKNDEECEKLLKMEESPLSR
jgi:hypothetical protein